VRAGTPMQAIGVDVFPFCRQRRFWMPKRSNVIVYFFLCRDLDQLHGALTPVAYRLDPKTRTPLET
jgi:hypothetical protein